MRVALAVLTSRACGSPFKGVLAAYFVFVSLGFIGQILRAAPTGAFGGPVWWNWNRYVHVVTYFLAALLLSVRCRIAFVPLALDVAFGAATWFLSQNGGSIDPPGVHPHTVFHHTSHHSTIP